MLEELRNQSARRYCIGFNSKAMDGGLRHKQAVQERESRVGKNVVGLKRKVLLISAPH